MAITINGSTGVQLDDNDKQEWGTGDDLQIYHDGTNNIIISDAPDLYIKTTSSETCARFGRNGGVDLYYDNSKVFETNNQGVKIQGIEGENGVIYLNADEGDDNADQWAVVSNTDGSFRIQNYADGAWENSFIANGGGNTKLFHNNTEVLETTSSGVQVNGNITLGDNNSVKWGDGSDLNIYHDGTNSFIKDPNLLVIRGDGLQLQRPNSNMYVKCVAGGTVELYWDNNKKFETEAGGGKITGSLTETSDRALKKDIQPLSNSLTNLKQLNGYSFAWKDNDIKSLGLIAQEVETIYPDLVTGEEGDKGLKYSGLIAPLLEAVKELSAKVETLETKVAALEAHTHE